MKTDHERKLSNKLIFLMACAVAATAANLYYNQPILPLIGQDFGLDVSQLGAIPSLNQLGYAAAILFISPLGDVIARRRLIDLLSLCLVLGSLLAAFSSNMILLGLACLVIGVSANITQQILPLVASLVSSEQKARSIATIMTGLTTGILLSRVVSGFVGEHYGWRAVFIMSAVLAALFGWALHVALPNKKPTLKLSYGALLLSLWTLFKAHPILRKSMFSGLFWFASFNALWATLAIHVSDEPFNYNTQQAGLFGIVALAGIIGAKLSAVWVNKIGAQRTISSAVLLILLGFTISAIWGNELWALIIGIVLIDLGVFSAQVANQVRVFSINPTAQSRINGVYMLGYYLGGSIGSMSGVKVYALFGWLGVCWLSGALLIASLIINHLKSD